MEDGWRGGGGGVLLIDIKIVILIDQSKGLG